jgi:hypothetical protein
MRRLLQKVGDRMGDGRAIAPVEFVFLPAQKALRPIANIA